MADPRKKLLFKEDLVDLYKKAKDTGKILLLKVDKADRDDQKHCISLGINVNDRDHLVVLHLAGESASHYTYMSMGSGPCWEVVQASKRDLLMYLDHPLTDGDIQIENEFGNSPSEIIAKSLTEL